MTETVFVDTSFFKALIDKKDDFHEDALTILQNLKSQSCKLVTTNYVLDETITLILVRCGVRRVKDLQEKLVDLKILKVLRITHKDEKNSWDWFWNDWSRLSFTDCTSFALLKRIGLTHVAAFDTHFSRAGFTAVK